MSRHRELADAGTVTILFGARDQELNQAVVLAGYLKEVISKTIK